MEAATGALPLPCGHTDPAQGAITAPRVGACAATSLHPRVLQRGQQETGSSLAFLVPLGLPTPTKVTPGGVEARAQQPAEQRSVLGV